MTSREVRQFQRCSGERQRLGAITKQGSPLLGFLWSEAAAHAALRDRELMGASSTLMSQNRNEEALKLLDDAIAMAIGEREIRWALAYCRQATYIAKLLKDFSKEKHYCEICLAHDPEDSWALTGLAGVARRQGEIELAEEYTVRCTKALHKRVGPARIIGPALIGHGPTGKWTVQ